MTLREKYDRFYKAPETPVQLQHVVLKRWPKDRVEAIVAMGGKGDAILDIGCGNGHLLYQYRNSFTTLIGLEYSPDRLAQAKQNLIGCNFLPIHGSAEDMSAIATESVDMIVSADTIEHIPDVYAAAHEMHRVLKPEGALVINTPNIAFLKKRLLLLLGRFPSTSQPNEGLGSDVLFDGGHLHYFTYRSLRLVLERAGFKMTRAVGYGKLGYVHHLWPSLLSVGVQWVARRQ